MKTLILLVIVVCGPHGWSLTEKKIIQNYKDRYEDFFERKELEKKRAVKRASGKELVKKNRKKHQEERESARLRFVSQRKPPKDTTKEFEEHQELEKRKRKAYLKLQEEFSLRQRRLEKVREGAIKIPPVLEFDLQDAL